MYSELRNVKDNGSDGEVESTQSRKGGLLSYPTSKGEVDYRVSSYYML